METENSKDEQNGAASGRLKRLVMCLRKRLDISENEASDSELIAKTKGSPTYSLAEIDLAFKDFGKAAKPIADQIAADFKKAQKRFEKARIRT